MSRLERLPGDGCKAKKTKRMISLLRNNINYRGYPKYTLVRRYWIYKHALLKEAAALVEKGLLRAKEGVY